MTESSAPKLAEAIVAAQAAMPKVEPDAVNPHFKSKFVSLDHLIAKTRPVLNAHGLAIVQSPTHIEGSPALTTTIHHVSGESLSSTMPLLVSKEDMQGLGGAITYARRYAWAAALGICADEDDDGNQASETRTERKSDPQAEVDTSAKEAALIEMVAQKNGDVPVCRTDMENMRNDPRFPEWLDFQLDYWTNRDPDPELPFA